MSALVYNIMSMSQLKKNIKFKGEVIMFKKLTSLFLAIVICVGTAMSVSAEPDREKIVEVSPIYVSSYARGFGANDAVYADITVASSYTAIFGGPLSNGCYKLNSGVGVELTFATSSYYTNIETGYYNYDDNTYTSCRWEYARYNNDLKRYEFSCSMFMPKEGNYKFYITNNTANYVTFLSPTVSY